MFHLVFFVVINAMTVLSQRVVKFPQDCQGQNCVYELSFNRNTTHTQFTFVTKILSSLDRSKPLWTGFGLSTDQNMVS